MARVILLTDFSEEYAKRLHKGMVAYAKKEVAEPWVLCKMPLSYPAAHGMSGVCDWALKWKADAIIGQFFPDDDVEIFARNGIIAIAQDFKKRFDTIPNITGEHREAGRMGAAYFIAKGFRNFAFYGFKGVVWSEERCEGFRSELSENGLERSYFEYTNRELTEQWYYQSAPLAEWLTDLPKPVALMACDDNQGHHIAEVCRTRGLRIPQDVAILGVDNDETVCLLSDPPLSSINQAVEKGGYEAAQMLDGLVHSTGEVSKEWHDVYVKPTHIVTRRSTDIYATDDKYISDVLQYIHRNIHKRLTVQELSAIVPLSRRLLETKFRAITGSPVYQYIFTLRIERFAQKLIDTDATICEIAEELGLSDHSNIARQFRKIKGCSPSEYRSLHALRR